MSDALSRLESLDPELLSDDAFDGLLRASGLVGGDGHRIVLR